MTTNPIVLSPENQKRVNEISNVVRQVIAEQMGFKIDEVHESMRFEEDLQMG
ncbi:MAG: hypothetical protein O7G85_02485 [Planctomycetota bacterium]|nr:hypothetical protein [Planctomycetota bacterium]